MVYCGPPPTSCASCRARKRRCDKATPACGQCLLIGKTCPGYSDPAVVRVRDETNRIIHRTKVINARRAASGNASKSTKSHSRRRSPSRFDSTTPIPSSVSGMSGFGREIISNWDNNIAGQEDNIASFEEQDEVNHETMERVTEECKDVTDLLAPSGGCRLALRGLSPLPFPGQFVSFSGCDQDTLFVSIPASPAAPPETLHALGMNYFLANYVLPGSGPCPGVLNYSLDILKDPLENRELVEAAIQAVGLAGVANATKADAIMYKARFSYAAALARVNAALVDSSLVKNNSTIFAALMLSMFETITCSSDASLKAWRHHIDGMTNLLILRGTNQFSTKPGLQLFSEALSHVLILHSRSGLPVSPRLRMLRVAMERQSAERPPSWYLSTVHIEVMDLYHLVNPAQEAPFMRDEWEKLLAQAVELDQRLEKIFAMVPASWSFKTVHDPTADPRIVYQGIYHVYYNTWVAKLWDGMRACRIMLHQAIYCLLLREGQEWAPQEQIVGEGAYEDLLHRSWHINIELRDGILASVPQMLGFVRPDDPLGTLCLQAHNTNRNGASNGVPASGPHSLLWYLYLTGTLPFNTLETRNWIVDRLRAICSLTGIQKAGYLADTIESHSALQRRVFPMNGFVISDFF